MSSKNKLLLLSACIGLLAFTGCTSESDERASIVKAALEERIASESKGIITLNYFNKTNGYEQNFMGQNAYIVEWEAEALITEDVWKRGNGIEGYWQGFHVMTREQAFQDAFMIGEPKEFAKGSTVHLVGECSLQQTENGWRPDNLKIKTGSMLANSNAGQKAYDVASGKKSSSFNWILFLLCVLIVLVVIVLLRSRKNRSSQTQLQTEQQTQPQTEPQTQLQAQPGNASDKTGDTSNEERGEWKTTKTWETVHTKTWMRRMYSQKGGRKSLLLLLGALAFLVAAIEVYQLFLKNDPESDGKKAAEAKCTADANMIKHRGGITLLFLKNFDTLKFEKRAQAQHYLDSVYAKVEREAVKTESEQAQEFTTVFASAT